MFRSWKLVVGMLFLAGLTVGCQTRTPPSSTASSAQQAHDDSDGHHKDGSGHEDHQDAAAETKVSAALGKLTAADRPLAEAQKFCAVMNHQRLGSMGVPIKFEIKGEPVFICCAGCKSKALKNPDETLAKVAALKSANKSAQ